MNNRGQVIFFGFMLGLVIILLGMSLAPGIKQSVDNSRAVNNMDCTNSSISYSQRAACVATDTMNFYFVGGIILIGGLVIGSRILIG
tara:strand:+ start:82 stop:342 length:261 start_codon:yes stop_codon:yes gene_type:complete